MNSDLRFPIGAFAPPADPTRSRAAAITRLSRIPAALRLAIVDLSPAQLETPYRPGGWTLQQLVHHVADSHVNFYTRLKLALTEENPTIRPYEEQHWAELADNGTTPVTTSLAILDGIHERADRVLRALPDAAFARTYVHPASGQHTVDYLIHMYAWHGEHHTAHVTRLREREGW